MFQKFGDSDLEASPQLLDALLSLNNSHSTELSHLSADGFAKLVHAASLAWKIGFADAFLIAFEQGANYDNPNFHWFQARYSSFVYVDRVVVDPASRGRGYARKLYEELFTSVAKMGHQNIACEVNLSPPNPASDAFHRSLGFSEVGTADIHGGAKTVRYLIYRLSDEANVR